MLPDYRADHYGSAHLSGWARIETPCEPSRTATVERSAHLSGWARIETPFVRIVAIRCTVAPTFRGGRGLKRPRSRTLRGACGGSAHLSGWARIETKTDLILKSVTTSSAHLSGWARIETTRNAAVWRWWHVAPTFRGGRGLKRTTHGSQARQCRGSAHLSGWARIETEDCPQ